MEGRGKDALIGRFSRASTGAPTATALSEGKSRAATLMLGLIAGCLTWILLLTVGVAAFFSAHPATMKAIQIGGALYIAYLAYGAFADAIRSFCTSSPGALHPAAGQGVRLFLRGIAMSMSNPLTILFFLAFLPNFTHEGTRLSPALQTLMLGTLFCALVPFIYLPIILAADFLRARLLGSTKAMASLKLASAIMLAAVVAILSAAALAPVGA